VLDIREPNACLIQTIRDGMDGKPGPMLNTAKSFLLRSSNQIAVAHQRRRRITVKSVQTKNNQLTPPKHQWVMLYITSTRRSTTHCTFLILFQQHHTRESSTRTLGDDLIRPLTKPKSF